MIMQVSGLIIFTYDLFVVVDFFSKTICFEIFGHKCKPLCVVSIVGLKYEQRIMTVRRSDTRLLRSRSF